MRKIISGKEAREALKRGLDKVVDTVKVTIGPKGRNVLTSRGTFNDGGLISQDITLKDKAEEMGASKVRAVISKTSEKVGGGRTATAILMQAIVNEGLRHVEMGANVNLLRKGIENAVKDISEGLKAISKPVTTREEVKQVASISTESDDLGEVIADVMEKIGKDGVVTVEEGNTFGITTEVVEGLKFDRGYISPWMATNPEKMEAEHKDCPILVTDRKISNFKEIFPIIEALAKSGTRKLAIIAEDIDGDALNLIIRNKIVSGFEVLGIKAPGFGDIKKDWLEDICAVTDATLWSESTGNKIEECVGKVEKILSTKDYSVIMNNKGGAQEQVAFLKSRLESTENKYQKDRLEQRIATVSNGVAVIKVGAASDEEIKYLKKKIEDGVSEAKRALEEGIIPGGDVAFVNVVKSLKSSKDDGYNIVIKAVEAPLRQIIINAGGSPDVILNEIKKSKSKTIGYDAYKEEMTDMVERGIIDATKVARTALENAASEASMFLTIEKVIVEDIDNGKSSGTA